MTKNRVAKKNSFFNKAMLALGSVLDKNKALKAIKKSFILLIPVFLTGSFVYAAINFPVQGYQDWLKSFIGGSLYNGLSLLYDGTLSIMSLLVLAVLSFQYAKTISPRTHYLQLLSSVVSISCFIASFGISQNASGDPSKILSALASQGVFYSVMTALLATRLFLLLSTKVFASRKPSTSGDDETFATAMRAVVPFLLTVAAFVIGNIIFVFAFHRMDIFGKFHDSANDIAAADKVTTINDLLQALLYSLFSSLGTNFGSALLYVFLFHIMWFFGLNGRTLLEQTAAGLFNGAGGSFYSQSFFNTYVTIGGCGVTLGLILAIIIFSRRRSNRKLAYGSVLPAVFNINAPVLFGLPIVLNPVMLIPFVVTPVITFMLSAAAAKIGWVPAPNGDATWTPFIWSALSGNGSAGGAILQVVNLLLSMGIYLPFIKLSERMHAASRDNSLQIMTDIVKADQKYNITTPLLTRNDEVGSMARHIALQLINAMENESIELHYQPKFDALGRIVGAEALLRWDYNGKRLYPPLIIKIAEEDETLFRLSQYIRRTAIRDCKKLLDNLGYNMSVSINATANELNRKGYVTETFAMLEEWRVPAKNFGIEVVEESVVSGPETIISLSKLRAGDITLFIDGFSMGNTSLKHLQSNLFDFVKLDGTLISDVVNNPKASDTVSSITALGESLYFDVIAGYVETEPVRNRLYELGCNYYQGFLMSEALPVDDFIKFAKNYPIARLINNTKRED